MRVVSSSSSLLSEQQKQLLLEHQQQLQQFMASQNFTPVRTHKLPHAVFLFVLELFQFVGTPLTKRHNFRMHFNFYYRSGLI